MLLTSFFFSAGRKIEQVREPSLQVLNAHYCEQIIPVWITQNYFPVNRISNLFNSIKVARSFYIGKCCLWVYSTSDGLPFFRGPNNGDLLIPDSPKRWSDWPLGHIFSSLTHLEMVDHCLQGCSHGTLCLGIMSIKFFSLAKQHHSLRNALLLSQPRYTHSG